MTQKFKVTVWFGRTEKNPSNVANNGYDFIREERTYSISVSDKEEELSFRKRTVAALKAAKKATKESGYQLTIPTNIVSIERL